MKLKDLNINQEYKLYSKQWNVSYNVKNLGNFGVGNKVYFSQYPSKETPETLAYKFTNNIMPHVFVCWDHMIDTIYFLEEICYKTEFEKLQEVYSVGLVKYFFDNLEGYKKERKTRAFEKIIEDLRGK